MKKVLLLLGSIVLFLISLFFLIGVIVLRDIDAIIIFGMPSLCFGMLCYFTFKKYLELKNFKIKDFYEEWKNSKFLRIVDLVLSCISYIFVLLGLSTPNSLLVIAIISTLIFGGLYIFKPLLGKKVDFSIFKDKKLLLSISIILLILITALSSYYLDTNTVDWNFANNNISYEDKVFISIFLFPVIIADFLATLFQFIIKQGLTLTAAVFTYLVLILWLSNCFNNIKDKKVLKFSIVALCLFVLNFVININNIVVNWVLVLLNIIVLALLIINVVIINNDIKKDSKYEGKIMIKKIILCLVMVLSLLYLTRGCFDNKNNVQNNNQNDKVTRSDLVKYMEDKYNDKFEYIASFDGGFDDNQKAIIVSSEKILGKKIYVTYKKENGIETYTDSYTQARYEEETYSLIKESLSKIFNKDFIITHNILRSHNNFNANTTFEDFLKSDESGVHFYAVVSPDYKIDSLENLERTVKEIFEEKFTDCDVNIYFASEKDEFLPFYEIPIWKKDKMKKIEFNI